MAAPPVSAPAKPVVRTDRDHRRGQSDPLRDVRRREQNFRRALACADVCAAVGSGLLSIAVIGGHGLRPGFLVVIPMIVIVSKLEGLYDHDDLVIRKSTLDEFPRLLNLATLFALLIWLGRQYVVVGAPHTSLLFVLWGLLIGMLPMLRLLARTVAGRISSVERCLFVGDEAQFRRLEGKLEAQRRVSLEGSMTLEEAARDLEEFHRLTEVLGIQRIVVSTGIGTADPDLTMDLVRGAEAMGLRVSIVPSVLGAVGSSVAFDDLGGMALLGVPRFGLSRSSILAKRAFDLIGSALTLLILAPVMVLIGVLVKADSAGPALFRQTRVGRDGRQFRVLKFRTMIEGADGLKAQLLHQNEASGLFKIADDPRATRIGRFLRQTSLDELPQLLNVLRGDMSLVGPRPLVLDEDERVTGYDRRRLHLTPGITGRWQILGSARIPLSEMVKIDYLYVANWSLWEDVKILVQTVGFVFRRRGL